MFSKKITVNLYKSTGKWYGQFEFDYGSTDFPSKFRIQEECLNHYTDDEFNFHVSDGTESRLYLLN